MSTAIELKNYFGSKLKELRTGKNLTQKQVAEAAGVSAASIIAYEKGNLCPPLDVAVRIAEYFGVSINDLCGMEMPASQSLVDMVKMLLALGGDDTIIFGQIDVPVTYWSPYDLDEAAAKDEAEGEGLPTSVMGIGFVDCALRVFMEGYKKMRALLYDGTIDRAVYDLWAEKEILLMRTLQEGRIGTQ